MDSDPPYHSTEHVFTAFKRNSDVSEQEVKDTLSQLPLLKKRLTYLNKKIAFYGDVDSVSIDLDKDPSGHRNTLAMHKLMKAELNGEKEELEALVKSATKTLKR